jgi:hypothetical protein
VNRWTWALVGLVVLLVVPILPDPYYHKHRVTLLDWLARELDELLTGERRGSPPGGGQGSGGGGSGAG